MLKIYAMQSSGNSYKVRLLLSRLGLPFELVDVDLLRGENRTPEFLMRNPEGRVPLLELPGGRYLPESNAILFYLADGTPLLPNDPLGRAEALRWMFFEQHSVDSSIGAARFWLRLVRGGRDLRTHDIDRWMEEGYAALGVMERHLARRPFFIDGTLTVADIALYAHTHLAQEGDFDLGSFPALRGWLDRVAAQPGHVGMEWRPEDVARQVNIA
ncbi:glutathione S-transferase family protein [Ancylobacter dichloromethanicus]|uniref:Glutathione S-transferase n=1 Tax=Ancylobacter dichloromethanicus TaxID=518825 RepID=A0A9W6J7Z7_9HYPH|nr:glutathione S-transferase family protein [Ancylobacter dichloromethanicus]MBS7553849.1 glutathione S-transferase family protein [Ancylobacter dichloromethanicus]GLK70954.1 glutathione S-transferase [Ancylobacter dichloromethanicus]